MILILSGKTKKGKNRIQQHGQEWLVLKSLLVPKLAGKHFIESLKTKDIRWIQKENDFNFKIESQRESV